MRRIALVYALLLGLRTPTFATPHEPKVTPAADGIFEAFKTHPLVGLGEWHGLAQMLDFYVVQLRDPRFAAEVGNIVVEIGADQREEWSTVESTGILELFLSSRQHCTASFRPSGSGSRYSPVYFLFFLSTELAGWFRTTRLQYSCLWEAGGSQPQPRPNRNQQQDCEQR